MTWLRAAKRSNARDDSIVFVPREFTTELFHNFAQGVMRIHQAGRLFPD
jgi:hypothetical protein